MNYNELYDEFLKCFPEDAAILNHQSEELSVERSDGMHVVFGMVVVPFILHLIGERNDVKLRRVFEFLEKMAVSDDPLICEVLEFTILEDIVSQGKNVLDYSKAYMKRETLKCCESVEKYMM